jgi:hypothetical protein
MSIIDPYIATASKPMQEWHLCELKIPPGMYANLSAIESMLNQTFNESIKNLFSVRSNVFDAFENTAIAYNNVPETDGIYISDASLSNTTVDVTRGFGYISDTSFIYETMNNGTNVVYNSPNAIVNVKSLINTTLKDAVIVHPAMSNNMFTYYKDDDVHMINETSVIKNEDFDNLLQEFTVISSTGTAMDIIDSVHGLKLTDVNANITKGILKSFPRYIGLDEDPMKYSFQDGVYDYTRRYNPKMSIELKGLFNAVDEGDSNQYSEVASGVLTLYDENYSTSANSRKTSSLISYKGDVDPSVKYRFYYDDNSLDGEEYYFIDANGLTDADGWITSSNIPSINVKTSRVNANVQISHGKDNGINFAEVIGYNIERLPEDVKFEAVANETYGSASAVLPEPTTQNFTKIVDANDLYIEIPQTYVHDCDKNGGTSNFYDANGDYDVNQLYYSDGSLTMDYKYCDISVLNLAAVRGKYSIKEAHAFYYDDTVDVADDGTYTDIDDFVVQGTAVIVKNRIIKAIIVPSEYTV